MEAIGFAQTHQVFQDGLLQFLFTSIHYYPQTFFKNLFHLQSFGHCTYQAFTHVLEGTSYALFLSPFRHDFRIWNYNSHQKRLESAEKWGLILFNNDQQVCLLASYLQAVSMHIELSHWLTPDVNVLNLLRGNVLALRQLENVFLPVDDFQCAILQKNDARVTRM